MNLLWRDSGKPVRFLGVDGRVAIGLVLVLAHISLWTIGISVTLMVAFVALEKFDYTLPNAGRKARIMLTGRVRWGRDPVSRRRYRSG